MIRCPSVGFASRVKKQITKQSYRIYGTGFWMAHSRHFMTGYLHPVPLG
jgi:hypothetical protein